MKFNQNTKLMEKRFNQEININNEEAIKQSRFKIAWITEDVATKRLDSCSCLGVASLLRLL